MREFLTIWAETIKQFPKKYIFWTVTAYLLLHFLLKYIAGFTFLHEYWTGKATISELLQFMQMLWRQ